MPIHPQGAILPFHLTGRGAGVLQTVEIDGSTHTITAEGHPAFGGTDSAPSPLDYVLATLTSCTQVTTVVVARELGVALGEFEIDLHAEFDNSVLVYGAEGVSNFDRVTLRVSLLTDADSATFARLVDEVERRCPITQLFRRSGVPVETTWSNTALDEQVA